MYEFWYDYIKNKYGERVNLCYTDTDSFIINVKTEDFYKDISENVIERFDTSNYIHDRPLPIGVNKKVLGLMKDELGGGIITEFVALRPKAYSYITNDFTELKKAKGTKKCVVNKMLRFRDYKNCLFDNFFFFYLDFLSRTFTNHRTSGEVGGHFIHSSLPLPPASKALRH